MTDTNSITRSTSFRLAVIGVLTLVLLIPGLMILGLTGERKGLHEEVIEEVSSLWGGEQVITGPVLTVPYRYRDPRGDWLRGNAHFLPGKLDINGTIEPEIRYRGIYRVLVYRASLNFRGSFSEPGAGELDIPPGNMLWEEAYFSLGLSDLRGIENEIVFSCGDSKAVMNPGIPDRDITVSGVFARADKVPGEYPLEFSFSTELRGTGSLLLVPVGKTTTAKLCSAYPDPVFTGSFLPHTRETGPDGFTAGWKVLQMNRNFPRQWTGNSFRTEDSAFGVRLMIPVDLYRQTERSVKYSVLFIGLTFLVFFFSEVIDRKRIHPLQYLVTGMALVLFYLLLLSLSEHTGFNIAYALSAGATTLLVSLYGIRLFSRKRTILVTGGLLVLLYGFLYILIRLTDYALLAGSLGLFVILAAIMVFTGRIDWYRPVHEDNEAEPGRKA